MKLIGCILIFCVISLHSLQNVYVFFTKIKFSSTIQIFLNSDKKHHNASPFNFVNSSPTRYVDRNGKAPIRICPNVSPMGAHYIHQLTQALTDDEVDLNYNGTQYEMSISIRNNSQINRAAGTFLIRGISELPEELSTQIDLNNSRQDPFISENSCLRIRTSFQNFIHTRQPTAPEEPTVYISRERLRSIVNLSTNGLGGSSVFWHNGRFILNDFEEMTPRHIFLAHELIHAYQSAQPHEIQSTHNYFQATNDVLTSVNRMPFPGHPYSETVNYSELRTVGLTIESPRQHALQGVDFSIPISENSIRDENNLPLRLNYKIL